MLRALYVITIGLLLAGVVGFGFSAFYPAPDYPDTPVELRYPSANGELTDEQKAAQEQYDADSKAAQDKLGDYNRNLAIGLIVVSLVIMAVSILGLGNIEVIGDGMALGGVFTLLYGLGRAMAVGDDKIRFIAVLVGLVILLFLTYWKFIKPNRASLPTV